MQIHEIFRRRTNEGVLKGISNAVSKVANSPLAKAVGSHVKSAASDYIKQKTGLDTEWGKSTPYGDQQTAAATAAAPVIKAQAEKQLELWNAGISKAKEQNNVQSLSQLPNKTKQGLAKSLMYQIHKNLLQGKVGVDYQQLPQWVDGKSQRQANDIVKRITTAKQSILNFNNPSKTAQDAMAEWQALSKATYDAMNLMQFNSATGMSGSRKKPNAPATPGSPAAPATSPAVSQAAQQIVQASGITQPQLQQVQNIVGNLPAANTQNAQTQAYLKALGFNTT